MISLILKDSVNHEHLLLLFQTKMILVKDGSGQGGALVAAIEKKRQSKKQGTI